MKDWAERVAKGLTLIEQPAYAPHQHYATDYITCFVCREIRARPTHLSESTEPNWNVFYEAGYAFGANKVEIMAEDANVDLVPSSAIFPELLRLRYHYDTDIYQKLPEAIATPHFSIGNLPTVPDPERLYFVDPGIKSDVVRALKYVLGRFRRLRYSETEGTLSGSRTSLQSESYELAAAGVVVGLLIPRNYVDQHLVNSRTCFLIGMAVALEKPTLLLMPDQTIPGPADLELLVRRFATIETLKATTLSWLTGVVNQDRPALRRASASVLDIDLGNAWAERDPDLDQYFLETASYRRARQGAVTLLLGRRGTGKSAIALTLNRDAATESTLAERTIRPESFEMEELQEAYRAVMAEGDSRHWRVVLGATWRYLLLSQLAWTYLEYFEGMPEQPPERRALEQLVAIVPHNDDFVDAVLAVTRYVLACEPEELKQFMAAVSRQALTKPLVALSTRIQGRIVLDNLDTTWDTHFEDSRFVLAELIRQSEWINQRFDQRVSVLLCLRSDIYAAVKLADPDVDKQSREEIRWDYTSLVSVIGMRLAHLLGSEESPKDAWTRVFPSTIQGQDSAAYLIGRTLLRPRELIKLCSLAMERAQARDAKRVNEEDLISAAAEFSDVLLTELHGEFLIELPDLYYFVSEFSMLEWPLGLDQARAMVRQAVQRETAAGRSHSWHAPEDPDAVLRKLYDVGVLGLGAWSRSELRQKFSFEMGWMPAYAEMRRAIQITRGRLPPKARVAEPVVVLHPGLMPALGGQMAKQRRRPYVEDARP